MAKKAKKTKAEEVATTSTTAVEKERVFKNDSVTLKPKETRMAPDDHDGNIRYSKCFLRDCSVSTWNWSSEHWIN